jgi:hypothetical protein
MLLAGALSAFAPACTFVIGERPSSGKPDAQADADDAPENDAEAANDAGEDAALEAAVSDAGMLEAAVEAGDASGGAADASDANDAADTSMDVVVIADASGDADTAEDTSVVVPDATPPDCDAGPVTWYPDSDNDGYGRTGESVVACPKPDGNWSSVGGDCRDGDAVVHPDQKQFFYAPYVVGQGQTSFDYDCSGMEEGDSSQPVAPDSCSGLLDVLGCNGGKGYEKRAERVGPGLNSLCGSQAYTQCSWAVLALSCQENTTVVPPADAYRCH